MHLEILLKELNIPNNYRSLPTGCMNYKRFFFLNELLSEYNYDNLVKNMEAYPKGRKYEKAKELVC